MAINGAVLLAAIGSLCSVIVYLYQRGEKRAEGEIVRLDQRLKDLIAAHELVLINHEREKDVLRKEVHDWQERAWGGMADLIKPMVEVLKDGARHD